MSGKIYIGGEGGNYCDPKNWKTSIYNISYYIGSGFWHDKNNWSNGKIPTIDDNVVLDNKCINIYVGYDPNTFISKFYQFISKITFGLFKTPTYTIFYKTMTLKTSGIITIEGKVHFFTPPIYESGKLTIDWSGIQWNKIKISK
ncbi:MAG: hypothetical protein AABY22_27095 [Nanoarchaeota archaeon]